MSSSIAQEAPRYGAYVLWQNLAKTAIHCGGGLLLVALPMSPLWLRAIGAFFFARRFVEVVKFYRAARHFLPGRDCHARIGDALFAELGWDGHGKLLDIGTGAGLVAVLAAERYPSSTAHGVDWWKSGFLGFHAKRCEENAAKVGVTDRCTFAEEDARALSAKSGTYDAVVSNSVFHMTDRDPWPALREAIRVLKPGGVFCFNDPFEIESLYGSMSEVIRRVEALGCERVRYTPMHEAMKIDAGLEYMAFGSGFLSGRKRLDPTEAVS